MAIADVLGDVLLRVDVHRYPAATGGESASEERRRARGVIEGE